MPVAARCGPPSVQVTLIPNGGGFLSSLTRISRRLVNQSQPHPFG
jgi:hypothetical protein